MEDYEQVQLVLNGESVPAVDLFILTGQPAEYKRILYAFAPITHYSEGIIGMVFLSASLDGISNSGRYPKSHYIFLRNYQFIHYNNQPYPVRLHHTSD